MAVPLATLTMSANPPVVGCNGQSVITVAARYADGSRIDLTPQPKDAIVTIDQVGFVVAQNSFGKIVSDQQRIAGGTAVTVFEAAEAGPVPTALVAVTVKE